jgi:N-acetylneuraminic acid mutarotase
MLVEPLLAALEQELRADFNKALVGLLTTARTRLENALVEVAKERANGLAEVATQKADLRREIEAMQTHAAQQEGRVELNIGGFRFETSVQTLRRVPHTFFDAYFSGQYAQDVCRDGSIFVDRDGENFGHVLEYLRDGMVSVAAPGAHPSVSLLRALKREFGFYCIELVAEEPAEQLEIAYVVGGDGDGGGVLSSMERYDTTSRQWSAVTPMSTARTNFGACVVAGALYVIGGTGVGVNPLLSVEKYTPESDTWSAIAPMPAARSAHAAIGIGTVMYVFGGQCRQWGGHIIYGSTLKYDCTEGSWNRVAPMPEVRVEFAACAVGTDVYVFGGEDEDEEMQDSVFKYDTVADAWTSLLGMPQSCAYHSACALNGLIYIVGVGGSGADVLCFDPASGDWERKAPTLHNRRYATCFVLGGSLYAAGGIALGSSMERYDVAANEWTLLASMQEGRHSCCAVTIGSVGTPEEEDLFDSLIAKASNR